MKFSEILKDQVVRAGPDTVSEAEVLDLEASSMFDLSTTKPP